MNRRNQVLELELFLGSPIRCDDGYRQRPLVQPPGEKGEVIGHVHYDENVGLVITPVDKKYSP